MCCSCKFFHVFIHFIVFNVVFIVIYYVFYTVYGDLGESFLRWAFIPFTFTLREAPGLVIVPELIAILIEHNYFFVVHALVAHIS